MTIQKSYRRVGLVDYWMLVALSLQGEVMGWSMGCSESIAYDRLMESLHGKEG